GVEERLLAEAIADDEQPLPARVPDGERVHSLDDVPQIVSVLLIQVREGLGVRPALQSVSGAFEPSPDRRVVVDLSVEGAPDRAVLVAPGLVAVVEVDDAEPPRA